MFANVTQMTLAKRVAEASARVRLHSQAALARACGVTPSAISQLVNGESPMNDLLDKVADICGVSANWLRDGGSHEAPMWTKDSLVQAIEQMQELANRLTAMRKELDAAVAARDAAIVECEALRTELAVRKDKIEKLAFIIAEQSLELPVRAAERTSRYKIGQTRKPVR